MILDRIPRDNNYFINGHGRNLPPFTWNPLICNKGGGNDGGDLYLPTEDTLWQLSHARKIYMISVSQNVDLFRKDISDKTRDRVLEAINRTSGHTLLLETKYSQRMEEFFRTRRFNKNCWIGVTVDDKTKGLRRLDRLRRVNSWVRFASMQPLKEDLGVIDLSGIDWVIVGGGIGPGATPMKSQWIENIKVQAEQAGCAFYFRRWGQFGEDGVPRGAKANGRLLNGKTYDAFPCLVPYFLDSSRGEYADEIRQSKRLDIKKSNSK